MANRRARLFLIVATLILVGMGYFATQLPHEPQESGLSQKKESSAATEQTNMVVTESEFSAVQSPNESFPQSVYTLIVRVWTREGHFVPGAVLQCSLEEPLSGPEVDPIVFSSDAEGRAKQDLTDPGPYILACTHGEYRAQTKVRFGIDNISHVDLVLRPAAEVRGETVDTAGKPVSGAKVTGKGWSYGNQASSISDEQGRFILSDLFSDMVIITATHDGFARAVSEPTQTGDEVRLVMNRGGSVEITARDDAANSPVGDLPLQLAGVGNSQDIVEGVTSGIGLWRVEGLAAGSYELKSMDVARVLRPVQSKIEVTVNAVTRADIRVEPAASIGGRVVDRDTGVGIAGVSLSYRQTQPRVTYSSEAVTDGDGTFVMTGLTAGIVEFAPSRWPAVYGRGGRLGNLDQIALQAGEQRRDVVVELSSEAGVRGKVVYENGDPAPGAEVSSWLYTVARQPSVQIQTGTTVADREGNFVLSPIPRESDLYRTKEKAVLDRLRSLAEAPREIFLQAAFRTWKSDSFGPVVLATPEADAVVLTLRDAGKGSIAGRVIRHDSGSVAQLSVLPIPADGGEANVYLSATTDFEGYFLLPDIVPGTYTFTVTGLSGANVYPIDNTVSLVDGEAVTGLLLEFGSSGISLTGIVYDEHGETVADYPIKVDRYLESGDEIQPFYGGTRTDENGRFVVDNVHEGTYRIGNGDSALAGWSMDVESGTEIIVNLPSATAGIE